MKTEWGLRKLLPLDTFSDASHGFLVEDSCIIGVELFLVRDMAKGESMSLVKDLKQNTYTWRIDGLSEKRERELSGQFVVGGPGGDYKWFICIYPRGRGNAEGKFTSVYLYMGKYSQVPKGGKVYAEYKLRIKHHFGKGDYVKEDRYWFTPGCYSEGGKSEAFIDSPTLKNGLLLNDCLVVEAEIMTVCLVKGLN
ncbi:hypothetical protein RJ640_019470 [Escallonia rubra]|uniref:MATH domain-containing protein n=1 Tax=Escallonia rubra TaxID=112253 RepID=A0AA88RTM8_9ASTE|nr:hypothetical protein RJ640_019470 [Escallonia rubra]